MDARVRHALSMVGIAEQDFEKSPFELSGGQKRRVAIAGVMAMSPEVLVLDEPTAGLDPMGREQILSEITRYHRKPAVPFCWSATAWRILPTTPVRRW